MTEETISDKNAILAKTLGFNYEASLALRKSGVLRVTDYIKTPIINGGVGDQSDGFYEFFAKSTQSLLQKWLRDEHKIIVLPIQNNEEWDVKVNNSIIELIDSSSYESALEFGLRHGLKILETQLKEQE